jgi:hypothetical protein
MPSAFVRPLCVGSYVLGNLKHISDGFLLIAHSPVESSLGVMGNENIFLIPARGGKGKGIVPGFGGQGSGIREGGELMSS